MVLAGFFFPFFFCWAGGESCVSATKSNEFGGENLVVNVRVVKVGIVFGIVVAIRKRVGIVVKTVVDRVENVDMVVEKVKFVRLGNHFVENSSKPP